MGEDVVKVAVLGAGSWGTALAVHAAQRGFRTTLWARRPEFAESLQRQGSNEVYLAGIPFPGRLRATADLTETADADVVLLVVPSHGFRAVTRDLFRVLGDRAPVVVSGTKGIDTATLQRMSEVVAEEAGVRKVRFAVLSGPTFAVELARGTPSAAVVASSDSETAATLCRQFSDDNLRLYSSTDVAGVELAGASKNVIAIGAGIVHGLGLGHNTLAALITRGLHEITRLGVAAGGDPRTMAGLAGLGDLVLTCTGGPSRNRRTGIELARGRTREEIVGGTGMVAEGIRNSRAVADLGRRHGVELPIVSQMTEVIYSGKSPRDAVGDLMKRDLKAEAEL